MELCRLAGLPDLNQTNPFVEKALLTWIANLTTFFDFDGLRIDTVPEVSEADCNNFILFMMTGSYGFLD